MPSTSRWGLRYPALADAPNGPAQMQALAEDVDDDLGGAISVLSTARPPHRAGRMIYESDTKRVYVSDGAAWEYIGSATDPGWADVPANAGWTGVPGSGLAVARFRVRQGVVNLSGVLLNTAGAYTPGDTIISATLPAGARPLATQFYSLPIANAAHVVHVDVRPDGTIRMMRSSLSSVPINTFHSLAGVNYPVNA